MLGEPGSASRDEDGGYVYSHRDRLKKMRARANPGARPAETGGPQAQHKGPPAVARCQPASLANMIRQLGQDKPVCSQEHHPPPTGNRAATSAALTTRKIPPWSPTVMRWTIAD